MHTNTIGDQQLGAIVATVDGSAAWRIQLVFFLILPKTSQNRVRARSRVSFHDIGNFLSDGLDQRNFFQFCHGLTSPPAYHPPIAARHQPIPKKRRCVCESSTQTPPRPHCFSSCVAWATSPRRRATMASNAAVSLTTWVRPTGVLQSSARKLML